MTIADLKRAHLIREMRLRRIKKLVYELVSPKTGKVLSVSFFHRFVVNDNLLVLRDKPPKKANRTLADERMSNRSSFTILSARLLAQPQWRIRKP